MNGEDVLMESEATQGGDFLSGFFGAAQEKISQFTQRATTAPTSPADGIGGSLFEAIYQFGRGKLDVGIERAITGSRAGQQAISNIEQQRIQQWLPMIIIGVIILLVGGFFLGRR